MWAGYFYGNYSIIPTEGIDTKAGISRYGYYNMQAAFYGFNRNTLLCPNYGYAAVYIPSDRDASGDVTYSASAPGHWVHQFFVFQSGSNNPTTGMNYEAGDTMDLYLMDYYNMQVAENAGFVLNSAT